MPSVRIAKKSALVIMSNYYVEYILDYTLTDDKAKLSQNEYSFKTIKHFFSSDHVHYLNDIEIGQFNSFQELVVKIEKILQLQAFL